MKHILLHNTIIIIIIYIQVIAAVFDLRDLFYIAVFRIGLHFVFGRMIIGKPDLNPPVVICIDHGIRRVFYVFNL